MSSRRNGSVSRAAEISSKNRLHMDRNPQHSRLGDPSHPAGRRRELDNVMKRARQGSPGTWDRKLLEVEEKDPNRWRHSGYKQMYIDDSPRRSTSRSPRRSRSPIGRRSPVARTRSPIFRARSSIGRRSPIGRRSRSPIGRRSPVGLGGRRSPVGLGGRRSPSPVRRARSPLHRRSPPGAALGARRGPAPRPRSPPPPLAAAQPPRRPPAAAQPPGPARRAPPTRNRPPSPPHPRKSSSGSSASSCSDESCSVCSAKNRKVAPPPKAKPKPKPSGAHPAVGRAVQPTRELLKAREASKRTREEKVLEWQRSQLSVGAAAAGSASASAAGSGCAPGPGPLPPAAVPIKREGEPRPPPPQPPPGAKPPPRRRGPGGAVRAVSPSAIAAALADTISESESEGGTEPQPHRLTLSERFGKMAQWSLDRSARLENMQITRRDKGLHVHIERSERGATPNVDDVEAAPIGSYPEELLAAAPGGLPSWDDVRVRYEYYKKRGYLRGLTLSDYVKWEEWWYKYQEWLKRERAYERWADGEGSTRRERRRRGGRHRRS